MVDIVTKFKCNSGDGSEGTAILLSSRRLHIMMTSVILDKEDIIRLAEVLVEVLNEGESSSK